MAFTLGTEARDDYYSLELPLAAHRLVTEVRPVDKGQQVLITADTGSDSRVVQATAGAVHAIGGVPTVVWYPTLPAPMQAPPEPLARAVTGADVWIDFAVAYQLYSPAYYAALEGGCIYVCLTAMDVDMMVRTVGRVTYAPMQEMATRLYQLSQAADAVQVTSAAGSDLTMRVDKAGDAFWEPQPAEGGFPQMLGGQSGYQLHRHSVEGVLVFDGALWPPVELGVLRTPVRLTIEGGYVKQIEGGAEATILARWLEGFEHPEAYLMDHACYGFNPGVVQPSGRILEDERVFGCVQFGVGAPDFGSPAHTDGVLLNPSVWLDDEQIEENGRYVHPELVELCRSMGRRGTSRRNSRLFKTGRRVPGSNLDAGGQGGLSMSWPRKTEITQGVADMLRVNMGLKAGERVLVATDVPRAGDWQSAAPALLQGMLERAMLARLVADVAAGHYAECEVAFLPFPSTGQNGAELDPASAACLKGADVVLGLTTYSLSHTNARQEATGVGVRLASMPGFEARMLEPGGPMAADYRQIAADCRVFAGLLDAADEAIVRSAHGTDLRFGLRGRRGEGDDGLYGTEPGAWGNLPAGETYATPLEGTGEGTLVVPAGWYPDLAEELVLSFEKGQVIEIAGGGSVGDTFRQLLDLGSNDPLHKARRNLAELGIGTNPNARQPDNVLEAEKIKGTVHIAIGDNIHMGGQIEADLHEDFVLPRPDLLLDGNPVIVSGDWRV